MSGQERPALVLYSSRIRWAVVGAGAAILVVGLGAVVVTHGPHPVPLLGMLAGVVAALVVAVDQPLRCEFDRAGIVRVCPLRRQRLDWDDIVALERLRRGGGLVARLGSGRRIVLVDRREGHAEHRRLRDLVEEVAPGLAVSADEPALDARPTDLYRRRRVD